MGKLKNGKAAGKDDVKGEKVEVTGWWTGFGGCVIWLLSDDVLEDWRSAVTVPLYKGEGKRTE